METHNYLVALPERPRVVIEFTGSLDGVEADGWPPDADFSKEFLERDYVKITESNTHSVRILITVSNGWARYDLTPAMLHGGAKGYRGIQRESSIRVRP